MPVTFKVDVRGLERTSRAFSDDIRKDLARAANRSALKIARTARQATPEASAKSIRDLSRKPWWPRYIAKRLHKKHPNRQPYFHQAEARKYSQAIIKARLRARGWLRSGFDLAIQVLRGGLSGRTDRRGAVTPATPDRLEASVTVLTARDARGSRILDKAIQRGQREAEAQLEQDLRAETEKTNRKYSA
jgi:hypothetical protein